jgi:hypothetical protein
MSLVDTMAICIGLAASSGSVNCFMEGQARYNPFDIPGHCIVSGTRIQRYMPHITLHRSVLDIVYDIVYIVYDIVYDIVNDTISYTILY